MTKCPHCFNAITADLHAWRCINQGCQLRPDMVATRFTGVQTHSRRIVKLNRPEDQPQWAPPTNLACPECRQPMRPICPTCHFELPPGWRDGEAITIAMAGARATGKSVYLGVMIKQLERLVEQMGGSLVFATERGRSTYKNIYEHALFEKRGIIQPTPVATLSDSYQREPLILSLGVFGGKRRFLVLRDVAGEDLERPVQNAQHLQFFGSADAIFYMFDPTQVPSIAGQLPDLVSAQLHEGGDPQVVLENLMRLVGTGTPKMSIILSKFDTMQMLRRVKGGPWSKIMSNTGAGFMRDPGMLTPAYDQTDGNLLHFEVQSLLHRLGAQSLVTSVVRPHTGNQLMHRFFVVSALGEAAEGERIHKRGIASFRCLDPVRWVLDAHGVL
ncbi:hypothetical protein ACQBAR_15100 [Propionibacteriaceae bacterium Y1685]|uniref:hypothetical protein n=1 Tax=Microlunatus sp. Y1700 TaxID=3418487 RepID=UPI003B7F426F